MNLSDLRSSVDRQWQEEQLVREGYEGALP